MSLTSKSTPRRRTVLTVSAVVLDVGHLVMLADVEQPL